MDAVLKNVREESAGLAWVFFPTDESESCVSYRAILKIHKMQILKKFSMGNGFRHIFFGRKANKSISLSNIEKKILNEK